MILIKKYLLFLLNLMTVVSLCFASQGSASAQSQTQTVDEEVSPPLFSELTWNDVRDVQKDVHVFGQILTLNGNMFKSVENLQNVTAEDIFEYYSSENLQTFGWTFVGGVDVDLVYQHTSGTYLTVLVEKCINSEIAYCVTIWLSTGANDSPSASNMPMPNVVAFNKTSPTNGAVDVSSATTYQLLKWSDAQIASDNRYQYCIDETNNQSCDSNNWITRNSLYSGDREFVLVNGHTYYWQVRTRDDPSMYANSGTWWSFTVKSPFPKVSSIVRDIPSSSTTNASSVSYKVTFDKEVTGVDGSDFTLTTTGSIAGASVGAVGGSGKTYTVLVNTGTSSGTIRLNLIDNDSIKDSQNNLLGGAGAGNGNFTTGEVYTIDKTPPSVLSSVPSLTATPGIIIFAVTFSENVTGVNVADFTLTTTGSVNGAVITSVTGTSPGSVYTVYVSTGGVGSGTIRLNIIDNDSIIDAFSNPLGGINAGNGDFITGTVFSKPTFADVPVSGSPWSTYWTYIESVYNEGITSGCGGGYYCPASNVTRAQMAVFLLRGMNGSAYSPPVATGTVFGDVSSSAFAAAWIEQLVADGITSGCGAGNYCPDKTITRAQMAVFLLRAKYGSAYSPPAATGVEFTDVTADSFAAAWIEQLASEGVTSGCGGGNYCPNDAVTRAQMAVFLQRNFNLPLP